MSTQPESLICMDIIVEEELQETATGVLALAAPFGWEEESLATGETRFRVHSANPAWAEQFVATIKATLPQAVVSSTQVPNVDWTKAWKEFFTPVNCGKFLVLAPWMKETVKPNDGDITIFIEPKTAFGTGHHPTTALCLEAISRLHDEKRITEKTSFLDLGTGSGILAIACAKLGLHGTGTDIDELAMENSTENCALNGISAMVQLFPGSTESVQGKKFNFVVANILALPLQELSEKIVELVDTNGSLVLSGLLDIQMDVVEAAYTRLGLPPAQRFVMGEWAALVWNSVEKQAC